MQIIYIFLFIMLFIAIIINKNNAKYLLSGYNTLSDLQKKTINIDGYLVFFKTFLIGLSISYYIIGFLLQNFLVDKNILIVYSILYPVIGILFLIYKSLIFYGDKKNTLITLGVLLTLLVLIVYGIWIGFKPVSLTISENRLVISGPYGKNIEYNEIKEISIIPLPNNTKKIKGFQLGSIRKGVFELENGKITTILSSGKDSCLSIITTADEFILDYDSIVKKKLNNVLIRRDK